MTNIFYEQGWIEILRATLNLTSDNIRVALLGSTYTPNATTDQFFSDISDEISGNGYAAGGELLVNTSIEVISAGFGRYKADNITVWNNATFSGARAAIIYKDTGVAATSALICYIDFVVDRQAPFLLNWSGDGIFIVNSASPILDQVADMEEGDLTDFDTTVGNVSATMPSALEGDWGMEINTTPSANSYGEFTGPTNEVSFTMQTLIDPNSLTMANGDVFTVLSARGSGTSVITIRVDLRSDAIDYMFRATAFLDSGGNVQTGLINIVDISQKLRVVWVPSSAPGSDDGFAVMYIDGVNVAILETIDNDGYDVDTLRVGAVASLDAGTSGAFYEDDCAWSNEIIIPNPLATNFDMPVVAGIGFDATAVNAITFTEIPNAILVVTIADQKPIFITPGFSEYKVRLKDQEGILVAEFDQAAWTSLTFTHKVNAPGSCAIEINDEDARARLFELDGQVEVWRRNQTVGLDWYLEWEGFHRTSNRLTRENDNQRYLSFSTGYLSLARRRAIMYFSGDAGSNKSGLGETVIKEYVNENAGPGALLSTGRIQDAESDGVTLGLSIEGDAGNGLAWSGGRSFRNLLTVIQNIADIANVAFDIIGTGTKAFEFRVYDKQRGEDRTTIGLDTAGLNSAGNTPVIFSLGFGNMAVPVLSENRSQEVTVSYVLGQGVAEERNIEEVKDDVAIADSPWNRIEDTINASNEATVSGNANLIAVGDEELEKNKLKEKLSFSFMQIPSTFYGKDYTWGDVVTNRYEEKEFNQELDEVRVTVSENAENGEEITGVFEDV